MTDWYGNLEVVLERIQHMLEIWALRLIDFLFSPR